MQLLYVLHTDGTGGRRSGTGGRDDSKTRTHTLGAWWEKGVDANKSNTSSQEMTSFVWGEGNQPVTPLPLFTEFLCASVCAVLSKC